MVLGVSRRGVESRKLGDRLRRSGAEGGRQSH